MSYFQRTKIVLIWLLTWLQNELNEYLQIQRYTIPVFKTESKDRFETESKDIQKLKVKIGLKLKVKIYKN